MNKKIIGFAILFMLVPTIVFGQTRQEFAVNISNIFGLSDQGSNGLYYYNDWTKIAKNDRTAVSSCAITGLFQPARGEYDPTAVFGSADETTAASGLDEYIFTSGQYQKVLGTVTGDNMITADDSGNKIAVSSKTAYLDYAGIGTCAELTQGEKVNVCLDSIGQIFIVWPQKTATDISDINDYEVIGIRQGDLYLWNPYTPEYIFKNPSNLSFGHWVSLNSKYDDFGTLSVAKVFSNGQQIWSGEVNENWLDKKANYVLGKSLVDGSIKILNVEFE